MTQYANLKALQSLPQSTITATATSTSQTGPAGADRRVTGDGHQQLGHADRRLLPAGRPSPRHLVRHRVSGDNELQSSIWSDNDVTLWPGESETLTATYKSADLQARRRSSASRAGTHPGSTWSPASLGYRDRPGVPTSVMLVIQTRPLSMSPALFLGRLGAVGRSPSRRSRSARRAPGRRSSDDPHRAVAEPAARCPRAASGSQVMRWFGSNSTTWLFVS